MLSYMHPVYKAWQSDSGRRNFTPKPAKSLIRFCLAGPGVKDRNIRRIHQHVANSDFVASQSRSIRNDLTELAEQTVDALSEKVNLILGATDADLETIEAPDAELLEKYPAFGESVEELLRTARMELESMKVAARDAQEEARHRGYI